MYTELIQRCKQMYLTESDGDDDSFYQLPSFLDSIASVLIHLDKVIKSVHVICSEVLNNNNIISQTDSLYRFRTIVSFEHLLCVHALRFQRCIHLCWSASLWCRLTASLSTARECRLCVAGPSLRCSWPWRRKDLCCGVSLAQWVRWSWVWVTHTSPAWRFVYEKLDRLDFQGLI